MQLEVKNCSLDSALQTNLMTESDGESGSLNA